MKLTIDTDDEMTSEQLYGLYVAVKKKEDQIATASKAYTTGFDAGYVKCHRDYALEKCIAFESGREEGYKEGYDKARQHYLKLISGEE